MLVLHSLPLEFPLAMAFAEQLLSWKAEEGEGKSEDEPDTIPTSVLLQVVELLGEVPPPDRGPGGWAQLPSKELARWTRKWLPRAQTLLLARHCPLKWAWSLDLEGRPSLAGVES